ncbi:MAG TPA: hypothetical protein VFW87_25495 [Pirellulales bacterium]|nr:hypothetical protein [Pirellulales bacterium]
MNTACVPDSADIIRQRLHLHPRATTRDIIASLAMDEIEVSVFQVRNIMRELTADQDVPLAAIPTAANLGMQRGFAS